MEKRITAKMVLDSSGFNESLKGVNAGLRNVGGELRNASAQVGTFGRDSENLKGVQEALGKQLELHSKKVDIYKDSISKSSDKLQDNVKERDKLKTSLDASNDSYDKAVKLYGKESEEAKKAKETVSDLEKEYKKKDQAIESNAKSVERYEGNLDRANAQLTRTQGELNKVNQELELSNNRWITAGETLTKTGDRMQTAGKGMTSVGNNILKATAPLIGVGIASLKVSADFEAGMSNVKALSQATGKDFEDLKEKAKEMGAATSMSATESADGMANLALAGWNTTQIIGGIEPVLRLAEAGNIDLARASNLTTDSMSALGLTVEDLPRYLDIVAQTARSSNTDIDQMAESYLKVGGVMKGLNVPLEESALAIGLLANKGIKGAESGTSLSAVMTNLTAPTGRAKKALDELGFTAFDGQGNFKGLENVLFDLKGKMEGMTQEQTNMYLSMIGGKEHIKTLNALMSGLDEDYVGLKNSIAGADGALMDMATTMQDNVKGDLTRLKSQLEGVGIQLGEVLIPMASDFIKVVSDWTERFANLSPATQEMIVKTGLFAVGLGGLLSVGGKVVSGAGTIVGVAGKLATAFGTSAVSASGMATATVGVGTAAATAGGTTGLGALASGLGGVVAGVAPFLIGAGAIAGVGYAIHKELSERTIPTLEIFDDTVSEVTKETVGNFLELEQKATASLNQLAWSGAEVTEEMKNNILGNFKSMKDEVVSKLQEQKVDAVREIEEMFKDSTSITDEEKQEMIKLTEEKYNAMIDKTEKSNERMTAILEQAKEENRSITEEEREVIIGIKEDMKEQGIKLLSETEVESLAILEKLKAGADIITAEMATEVVKNSLEQKEKSVKNAEDEYNERLKFAATLRAEGSKESEDLADKVVKEAKRQKEESVQHATEMHEQVVGQAKLQAKEHIEQINWETGEIMTEWGKLKRWFEQNPIIRSIKTKMDDIRDNSTYISPMTGEMRGGGVRDNWRGNANYEGGLTTLHERGYEIYNLPQGSRIYNHEASQDQVMKTAEAVARRMVSGAQSGGTTQNVTINSPSPLSPSEVARRFKNVNKELAMGI